MLTKEHHQLKLTRKYPSRRRLKIALADVGKKNIIDQCWPEKKT